MGDKDHSGRLGEFDLIAQIFSPLSKGYPGAFNLTDDCASYSPEPGHDLVVTKDTIVSGVHFLEDNPPASIAIKALAVNLSDLAAKGAEAKVYLLSIALPKSIKTEWLEEFAGGLAQLQKEHNIYLIGGDTVSIDGPLTITVTLLGQVPTGKMVLRCNAGAGDAVYVTGTIGDSWLGLQTYTDKDFSEKLSPSETGWLKNRYLHPQPRNNFAAIVQSFASASMDISDGLVTDFNKLCQASEVGGVIRAGEVPLSEIAEKCVQLRGDLIKDLITGGDDYELLLCIPESNSLAFKRAVEGQAVKVTKIGVITNSDSVDILDHNNKKMIINRNGYDHFHS